MTMRTSVIFAVACLVCVTYGQYDSPTPPRPFIPGAVPVGAGPVSGARPVLRRRPQQQQSIQELPPPRRVSSGRGATAGPARRLPSSLLEQNLGSPRPSRPTFSEPVIRAPQPTSVSSVLASPAPAVQPSSLPQQYSPPLLQQISPRPVVEDAEEEEDFPPTQHLTQSQPQQLSFRPSPIDDIPVPTRQQFHRPTASVQPAEEETPSYVRQSRPQEVRNQQPEVVRQPSRPRQQPSRSSGQQQYNTARQQTVPRPVTKEIEKPTESRVKKPEVQNIRKYRLDNDDGSITWGFENDDGTYKEETIGTDCITSGKYGYVDPDGVRREFTYESGIPCDKREPDRQETNEGYIDYSNNRYVFPNGEAIDLENMVKNKARKPNYRNP